MTLSVAAAESGGNWNLWQKWAINIVGKTRRRRRHVCAIFQAFCAIFASGHASIVVLHFAVKIDIKDG